MKENGSKVIFNHTQYNQTYHSKNLNGFALSGIEEEGLSINLRLHGSISLL
uniref:Uncharacterized protein n=1 Tax=Solanum tuberosum TaxID=4113 RepID=M1D6X0_SOLTU